MMMMMMIMLLLLRVASISMRIEYVTVASLRRCLLPCKAIQIMTRRGPRHRPTHSERRVNTAHKGRDDAVHKRFHAVQLFGRRTSSCSGRAGANTRRRWIDFFVWIFFLHHHHIRTRQRLLGASPPRLKVLPLKLATSRGIHVQLSCFYPKYQWIGKVYCWSLVLLLGRVYLFFATYGLQSKRILRSQFFFSFFYCRAAILQSRNARLHALRYKWELLLLLLEA